MAYRTATRSTLVLIMFLMSARLDAAVFDDSGSSHVDYRKATIKPRSSCQDLNSLTTIEYSVVSAVMVDGVCRVTGVIPGEIRFEVNLPNPWNGRLMMTGNGGLAGQAPESPGARRASKKSYDHGFATAFTDTGHDSRVEPGASFAHNNLAKLLDYGYRGVHLTNQTARKLIDVYYRRGPKFSYFMGCSNGGRQALMEAQRFPEDFDGIVAGAPANDFSGLKFSQAHRMKAMKQEPLTIAEIRELGKHVYAQCDGVDGLEDGLIDDPRACDFSPGRDLPRCDGEDKVSCFDDSEISALELFYSPVMLAGKEVYPAFPVGSEGEGPYNNGQSFPGWVPWVINSQGRPVLDRLGSEFFRFITFVKDRPDYDWTDFEFDEAPDNLAYASQIVDAVEPDLGSFQRAGGKILSYFGWADPDINPLSTLQYYEAAEAATDGTITDFYRLFMVPGMFHCGGGPGPSDFDVITPLINWVEKDIPPGRIEARHTIGGKVQYTRPLCPYPERAVYQGDGDPKDSVHFACQQSN